MTQEKTIEQVLAEYTDRWMSLRGVVGTGIGEWNGKPCVKVFTSDEPSALKGRIPGTIENFPILIEKTGGFSAMHPE